MAHFLSRSALVPLLTVSSCRRPLKFTQYFMFHCWNNLRDYSLIFHILSLHEFGYLVVEPLQVLEWKWNNANVSPIKLALVQWIGLAPKDTSWEHWDNVRVSYNLEDKVLLLDGVMIALVSWPLTDQGGPPGGQHTSAITHKGQL